MPITFPLPFVGREPDLQLLQADLDRVLTQNQGYTVFLLGPLGIGKTRLVTEFLRPHQQSRRLATLQLQVADPGWESLAHQILRLCVPFYRTRRTKPTDPGEALRLVTDRRPLVFHLDDLHVLEETALDHLFRLIQTLIRQPVLFLLTTRDHMTPRLAPLQNRLPTDTWRVQHLEPLSQAQVQDLLTRALGAEPPPRFLQDLYENTRGIPFFIEEALRLSLQRNLLEPRGETWHYRGYLAEIFAEHPSIHHLIQSRYQSLSEQEKQTLRVFALLGTVTPHGIVEALKHHPRMTGLSALIAHGILILQDQGVAFFHPLMQRVVAQQIQPRERQELLSWLLETLMTLPRPDAFLVARLLTGYQIPPRPVWFPKLRQIMGDLALAGAYETAEQLAHYVLYTSTPGSLGPRERLRLEVFRATLVQLSRSRREGLRMLEALLEDPEIAQYPDVLAEAVFPLVHQALETQQLDRAEGWLQRLEPYRDRLNERHRQSLHYLQVLVALRRGDTSRLQELETILQSPDLEPAAGYLVTTQVGKIAWERGEVARALEYFTVALEWARRSGSRMYQALALQNIRSAAEEEGAHDLWHQTTEALLNLAQEAPHPVVQQLARQAEAELLLWKGQWQEAHHLLRAIQQQAEAAGRHYVSLNAALGLLELFLWTDPEQGYATARSFLPTFHRYPYTLPDVYAYLTFYGYALNRWHEAYSHLQSFQAQSPELSQREQALLTLLRLLYGVWEGHRLPEEVEQALARWETERVFSRPWKPWIFAGVLLHRVRWFEHGAELLLARVGRARVEALTQTLEAYRAPEEFREALQRILARESAYRVYLFGEFTVLRHGEPVEVGFQKEKTLLGLLLVERRPMTRDEAMEWLWPEADPDRVRGTFHNVVSRLRQALGDVVNFTEHTLSLQWDRLWVDLWDFKGALQQGLKARDQGDLERARQEFLRALELVRRGRLLANLDHPLFEEELDTRVVPPLVAVLDWLAGEALEHGRPLEALEYAREIRRWNASDERGILRTVEALLALGDRGQARQALQSFVEGECYAGFSPQGMEKLRRWGLLEVVRL